MGNALYSFAIEQGSQILGQLGQTDLPSKAVTLNAEKHRYGTFDAANASRSDSDITDKESDGDYTTLQALASNVGPWSLDVTRQEIRISDN